MGGESADSERLELFNKLSTTKKELLIAGFFRRHPIFLALILAAAAAFSIILYLQLFPVRVSLRLAEKVPLAAEAVVRTGRTASVRVTVFPEEGDDAFRTPVLSRGRVHRIPVLGLYPGQRNRIVFTVTTDDDGTYMVEKTLRTDPLPSIFPRFRIRTPLPDETSWELLLLHLGHYSDDGDYTALPCVIDSRGRVRWYYAGDNGHLLSRLRNGNMMIQSEESIVEIDILGRDTGNEWEVPGGLHHDAIEMPGGNFLALSSAEESYYDSVVEIARDTGEVLRTWDFRKIIDPERPVQPANLSGEDWLHLNAVVYDADDEAILVSGRDQSAVVKVSYQSGELLWILGNHSHWGAEYERYLLQPVGEPFRWQWGQHAPMLHPDDHSRILVFDNGNARSYDKPLPADRNFSRGVEYRIDEQERTVRQLWQYGRERGSELYAPFIGDADYLPGGNRLICFGGVTKDLNGKAMEIFDFEQKKVNAMKISARVVELSGDLPARLIREVTIEDPDPDSYRGYRSYRADTFEFYPDRRAAE